MLPIQFPLPQFPLVVPAVVKKARPDDDSMSKCSHLGDVTIVLMTVDGDKTLCLLHMIKWCHNQYVCAQMFVARVKSSVCFRPGPLEARMSTLSSKATRSDEFRNIRRKPKPLP